MQCPRCHAQNYHDAKFCEECGARLEQVCPSCGQPVGTGKKFCRSCGAPVVADPSRFTSPQVYTPKHLAEKILTSKAALEGERKQVTVLFADLKGSMELLANRDPEEARKLLDPVLKHMMDAVHRYEGTVNQVMGDGIMALFGAPLAHEDHAVRACYAALRMQESVTRYAEKVFRTQGARIEIRVGLNSGDVVVRAIESDLHMDYTAVGQTTHLAARMEQMAAPGTILLAPATLRLAEDYVQVAPLGPATVKGLPEPVDIHVLIGAIARTRLQAGAARGLTRFVGRDPEMEQIRRALGLAREGHGQLVAVVGEPGVGKSRLFHEFSRSVGDQGWLILEAGSVSYGKATSYLPVINLLKTYCQIESQDDARKIHEKVTGKILALDRALEPTLPAFLALLDVPVEDAQWQALDPLKRRQRTLDACKRLLLRESQVQPLLVIFEDLHWIDSETQASLDSIIESLPTARLLLLVNYRPEYEHGWGSKTFYTQLRIDPLPTESADALLQGLLGSAGSLDVPRRQLLERTQGNPFFLEESVRALVETKVLLGEHGAYQLGPTQPIIQVPATVQAVLASRIDRLGSDEKHLLQAAAVVGKDVPFVLLQAISEEPEDRLRAGLARLQAAELLYEARLFPDLEYTFKHALTHEVAYGSLVQDRRRTVHAQIVDAIERLFPDRLTEQVETLGHHALRGEQWEKAVTYLRLAGAKAVGRSANREAVQCFEQAMAALSRLPETREGMAQAIDLRIDLRNSLVPLGEFVRMLTFLQEAELLAEKMDDSPRRSALATIRATALFTQGDFAGALQSAQRAQAIASTLGDGSLDKAAKFNVALAHWALGDYRPGIQVLQENVAGLGEEAIRERFGTMPPALASSWLLAVCHSEIGEFVDGVAHGNQGLRIAEIVDQPRSLAPTYWGIGYLYCHIGEFPKAIGALERAVDLCREWDLPFWHGLARPLLGYAYSASGRLVEALALLDEQTKIVAPEGLATLFVPWAAEGYLLAGRVEQAAGLTRRALDFAREHKARGCEAAALRLQGDIASLQYPQSVGKGVESYRQALAQQVGMRPLVAHCHLGLGRLYRRTAQAEQATENLITATVMYREMGMMYWLEKAETTLRELA